MVLIARWWYLEGVAEGLARAAERRPAPGWVTAAPPAAAAADASEGDPAYPASAPPEVVIKMEKPRLGLDRPAPKIPSKPSLDRAAEQHYLSGVIYYQKGSYERAREEWLQAKSIDPDNPDVLSGLARVDALIGEVSQ